MKKYPYTESTGLVVYEDRRKKRKKRGIFLPCILSALIASVVTGSVVTFGMITLIKPFNRQNMAYVSQPYENLVKLANTSDSEKTPLSIVDIAYTVGPSCVGVINKAKIQPQRFYDPFTGRYYYTQDPKSEDMVEQGSGSGIIISEDGYVVTNQHVIDGASEITVVLNTGDEYTAKLVGEDVKSDLAVLKIDAEGLVAAVLGDSETVRVGEVAVAIGNPLGQEFAGSVTAGVVSAVNRTMTVDNTKYNLIQTDAAINPGNSGGALVNIYGEVIGINSVKIASSGVEGIGFAISISEAKPIIDDLISDGYVSGRPLIGITAKETSYGISVNSVEEGSGADRAGIKVGDLIVKIDGTKVMKVDELNEIRDKKKAGETVILTVVRDGEMLDIELTLGEDLPTEK
ncbi:MAG: trypsin-like peptidase domain-containing protein [Clostridia bacterium]|nr:trypsin-like peptidase domain-containing protein [Clostridia bacterium]